jgi:hypothetical protein
MNENLYHKLVVISEDFLGPATERFLTVQIHNHLHKMPEDLKSADIPELVRWLKISLAFVSSDTEKIEEYIALVRKLKHKK